MLGRILSRIRRYLVTGLIVVAPVGVTAWVLVWLFQQLDSILGRYLRELGGYRFPGLGLLVLVILLVFVGWMLRWAVGRKLVGWGNRLLSRLPLTRRIYNASSQIAQTVLDRQEKFFRSCALIEYPHPGSYTLAFVTARAPTEVEARIEQEAVSVFLPTAPNPASGYVLMIPADRVRLLEMSVEDGMKLILSAGAVRPGDDRPALVGLDLERLTRLAGPPGEGLGGARGGAASGKGEGSPSRGDEGPAAGGVRAAGGDPATGGGGRDPGTGESAGPGEEEPGAAGAEGGRE